MKDYIKNSIFSIRPKYKRISPLPPCHVIDKIQEELSMQNGVEGITEGNDATLRIQKKNANIWSPRLEIQVRKKGKGSTISGRMVPGSKVWTFYILLSSLALILIFLGVLMLVYKWIFNMESPLAWSIPLGILIAIIGFVLVKISQLKGKKQIEKLWSFFDELINAREKKQRDLLNELFPDEDILI